MLLALALVAAFGKVREAVDGLVQVPEEHPLQQSLRLDSEGVGSWKAIYATMLLVLASETAIATATVRNMEDGQDIDIHMVRR